MKEMEKRLESIRKQVRFLSDEHSGCMFAYCNYNLLCMFRSHCTGCTTFSGIVCIIYRTIAFILVTFVFHKTISSRHILPLRLFSCLVLFLHQNPCNLQCTEAIAFHCRNAGLRWCDRIRGVCPIRLMSSRLLLLASWT